MILYGLALMIPSVRRPQKFKLSVNRSTTYIKFMQTDPIPKCGLHLHTKRGTNKIMEQNVLPTYFYWHITSGMGTKIEYAINILGTSENSSSLTVHRVDDWDYFQKSGLKEKNKKARTEDKIQNSMDRMLDKHNIDTIKKTMQMHEDTFKHQRLRDDPISREGSGSCSGDTLRMSRGFDLERPAEEDMSTGVSTIDQEQAGPSSHMAFKSKNMSIAGCDEDSEVELTLSIGSSKNKKRSKSYQPQLGCAELIHNEKELDSPASFKSDRGGDCSDPTTPMSSSSATFDQERKQPHWLFHDICTGPLAHAHVLKNGNMIFTDLEEPKLKEH
ncbi:hypothetical protein Prudu_000679 [Prunus dulcis]|uniref:Uncharacterized protein n=1 Tax=Prunus dulcis TaxID=3755 RepID=A0A4Y1QM02_PRUDU|nr:hypothetical protein Prudu_000679 [Prunus dulcis]